MINIPCVVVVSVFSRFPPVSPLLEVELHRSPVNQTPSHLPPREVPAQHLSLMRVARSLAVFRVSAGAASPWLLFSTRDTGFRSTSAYSLSIEMAP